MHFDEIEYAVVQTALEARELLENNKLPWLREQLKLGELMAIITILKFQERMTWLVHPSYEGERWPHEEKRRRQ